MTTDLSRLTASLVDRYRIERELGAGGMATVYLAEDLRHRRKVAIKVLRPELSAALGPERFLREIETTANLRHPHILPLYDSGEADGFLFYVMPLVEGESLRDRITRERQLPIEEALAIAREVADALGYAHNRGIIHRDIKPENILLEGGHAVVADFSIARAVSAAGAEQLTRTGMSIGTPSYVSPEQAAGELNLDGRSDLYALGCVLYEMLGGQPPFTGPTVESVVHQHLKVEAPPITNLRPTVPVSAMTLYELRWHGHVPAEEALGIRLLAWLDARPAAEANTAQGRRDRAVVLMATHRWSELQALTDSMGPGEPGNVEVLRLRGVALAMQGKRAAAEAIEQALERDTRPIRPADQCAFWAVCRRTARAYIAAALGDKARAVALIDGWVFRADTEAHFDLLGELLRDYAPFQELAKPAG